MSLEKYMTHGNHYFLHSFRLPIEIWPSDRKNHVDTVKHTVNFHLVAAVVTWKYRNSTMLFHWAIFTQLIFYFRIPLGSLSVETNQDSDLKSYCEKQDKQWAECVQYLGFEQFCCCITNDIICLYLLIWFPRHNVMISSYIKQTESPQAFNWKYTRYFKFFPGED